MMKRIMDKLNGKRNIGKWTLYAKRFYASCEEAYEAAKFMNGGYRRTMKRIPGAIRTRATVNPLPNGMAELWVWRGQI